MSRKQIIIAGVARAGKSTVCNELSKREHYQHIEADTITFAFQNSFPETGISHTDFWGLKETSKPFSKFLSAWIKEIQKSGTCNKTNYKIAIDLYHILPEDFVSYFPKENCEIYFLGYPNISVEEKLKQIRCFDTVDDWTTQESDESLKERIETYIEISKYLQEECQKYGLPFIDVSHNREKILEDLINKIM